METAWHIAVFIAGAALVLAALRSAVRTVILPRGAVSLISRASFLLLRRLAFLIMGRRPSAARIDAVMSYYGPLGLFAVLAVWLLMIIGGFTLMYWAMGVGTVLRSFRLSGSSVFTLGFAAEPGTWPSILTILEAGIGIAMLALMITYLPSIYMAFSRRELYVTRLEVRAGSPASGVQVISLAQRLERIDHLKNTWPEWEAWFGDIAESHSSFPVLVFFRSQRPEHHWLTAAGAVLDAAAFRAAVIDAPREVEAELCLRAGYLCLQQVADYFSIAYDPAPKSTDPISITRTEFEEALDTLEAQGVAVQEDRDNAWLQWSGWRVNYDAALVMLCRLTLAPPAPWSSDRDTRPWAPRLIRQQEGQVPRKRRRANRTEDRAARTSQPPQQNPRRKRPAG